MTTVVLSGLPWRAVSPSIYTLAGYPVWLAYNGHAWYLAINGDYAGARPWPSRNCAVAAIAQAFVEHEMFGEEVL